jgi:hypothetical protein
MNTAYITLCEVPEGRDVTQLSYLEEGTYNLKSTLYFKREVPFLVFAIAL